MSCATAGSTRRPTSRRPCSRPGPAAVRPARRTPRNANRSTPRRWPVLPKGQLIGIVGAPDQLPSESDLVSNRWTVCDSTTVDSAEAASHAPSVSTTVLLGVPIVTADRVLPNVAELVMTTGDGAQQYLLWNGARVLIEPSAVREVSLALHLDGVPARPISVGLLNAIPAAAPLDQPDITDAGDPVSWSSLPVGSVFTVALSTEVDDYVVLSDGVQQIGPAFRDLIQASAARSGAVPTVALSDLKRMPISPHPAPDFELSGGGPDLSTDRVRQCHLPDLDRLARGRRPAATRCTRRRGCRCRPRPPPCPLRPSRRVPPSRPPPTRWRSPSGTARSSARSRAPRPPPPARCTWSPTRALNIRW
jgi:hypothetical protein